MDPIRRHTVVEQVMDRIRELIASGDYRAGDRMPTEQEMAKQFGVGRSSIREAIKTFNYLGVLESKAAKGTYLQDSHSISSEALTWSILLGSSDLYNLVETRAAIELWSAITLVEQGAGGAGALNRVVEGLESSIHRMEAAIADGNIDEVVEADYDFHRLIISGGKNSLFESLYATLKSFMFDEIRKTYISSGDLSDLPGSHQKILDTMRAGSVERVARAVRDHIDDTKAKLATYFVGTSEEKRGGKSMKKEPLRVIIAGAGRIGELHARNIHDRLPALEVCAIVEPQPSGTFAEWAEYRSIPVIDDFNEGITKMNPAAALIAVPTDLHEDLASKALAAGLHVFCEKPIAPDIPAAKRIIKAAEEADRILQIGFNRRFDRNFAALASAVASRQIGTPEMVRITSRDPAPPPLEYIERSGGLFMDMTIHDFDMVRFLSKDEFAEVHVTGAALVDPAIGEAGDIDSAVIAFRLRQGAIGFIENSRRAVYGYDQRAEILGSNGAAAIENERPSTLHKSTKDAVSSEKPLYFFLERYGDSFITELNDFATAIAGGGPVKVSGLDGIQAMRVAEACRLSLKEGRSVSLEEID